MGDSAQDPAPRLSVEFLRHLAVPVWVKDAQGRYVFANQLAVQTMEGTRHSISGLTDFDLYDAKVAGTLRDHDHQVIAGGVPIKVLEEMPDPAGGARVWFSIKFPLLLDGRAHVAGVAVDITGYSRAAQDTHRAQNKSYQILDAINDMILVKGADSKLEWANKAFREMYGMSNEQLQGILDAPFSPPDQTIQYVRDDLKVWSTGEMLDIPEEPITRCDGAVRLVHTLKTPIFDDDGNVINTVGVSRDITDRKALELELQQAQKLESVGRLAAGIAHEINTPIQFIGDNNSFARGAFTDLLALVETYRTVIGQAAQSPLSAEALQLVQAAEEAADLEYLQTSLPRAFSATAEGVSRVARLVIAMKEFGQPDRGERSAVDINRALSNALTILANQIKQVATVTCDMGDLPPVFCRIGELNQVFVNLLTNAAHAIADARPGGHGTILVTTRCANGVVTIAIADDGTGIASEHRGKIFESFFTTKEVGRGTGQGLSVSRMVVEKHGGKLSFETEEGRGTTFILTLPVSAPAAVDPAT